MRIRTGIAVAVAVLSLTACSVNTATVTTTPAGHSSKSKPAQLGDTIAIAGQLDGEKIAVTLVKVDPHARATDGFSSPSAGDRYYAVQFRIKNVGSTSFSDAINNDVTVQDALSQSYQTTIVTSISSGPMFGDTTTIASGGTALGWVVLEVKAHAKITQAQFTTDSGMGSTGQWRIG